MDPSTADPKIAASSALRCQLQRATQDVRLQANSTPSLRKLCLASTDLHLGICLITYAMTAGKKEAHKIFDEAVITVRYTHFLLGSYPRLSRSRKRGAPFKGCPSCCHVLQVWQGWQGRDSREGRGQEGAQLQIQSRQQPPKADVAGSSCPSGRCIWSQRSVRHLP